MNVHLCDLPASYSGRIAGASRTAANETNPRRRAVSAGRNSADLQLSLLHFLVMSCNVMAKPLTVIVMVIVLSIQTHIRLQIQSVIWAQHM